jgi:hypothetical protein
VVFVLGEFICPVIVIFCVLLMEDERSAFFFVCYQKGSFGRLHHPFLFLSEAVRVGVLERRDLTEQKVIILPQGWHGFYISFSFLLLFCVWKNYLRPNSIRLRQLYFSGLGNSACYFGWTGLDSTGSSFQRAGCRPAIKDSGYIMID